MASRQAERTIAPTASLPRAKLQLPDRFEPLRRMSGEALRAIVCPVRPALVTLDTRFAEMRSAGRGSLLILRGESGAGKSTFLDTVHLFREGVETSRVPPDAAVADMLAALGPGAGARIVVLEGREALREESKATLESTLHAINAFVRSEHGAHTLVVWPTNTNDLSESLRAIASSLGAEALLGCSTEAERFYGPERSEFVWIAEQTVQALNQGATLASLGMSDADAAELAGRSRTIGHFLYLVRLRLLENEVLVDGLLARERCHLWTVVVASGNTFAHVSAVTRGTDGHIDMDRLLAATNANVVHELRKYPHRIGMLGTSLDARIFHLDPPTAVSIAHHYGGPDLHGHMRARGLSPTRTSRDRASLTSTDLGAVLAADILGRRRIRRRVSDSTEREFARLVEIARTQDGDLNRALGNGLAAEGLIDGFDAEAQVGGSLRFASDLRLVRNDEPIRLELMWRTQVSEADIAVYVLNKLHNYGRTIGYLT
jgi:hypothetical protein